MTWFYSNPPTVLDEIYDKLQKFRKEFDLDPRTISVSKEEYVRLKDYFAGVIDAAYVHSVFGITIRIME